MALKYNASHKDVVKATLHALKAVDIIHSMKGDSGNINNVDYVIHTAYQYCNATFDTFWEKLLAMGWNVDHLFIEEVNYRYKLIGTRE